MRTVYFRSSLNNKFSEHIFYDNEGKLHYQRNGVEIQINPRNINYNMPKEPLTKEGE